MNARLEQTIEGLRAEREELVDALDHIERTCRGSRTQTRRLRWIAIRARCAIDGRDDWRTVDVPVNDPLIEQLREMIKAIYPVVQAQLRDLVDNYSTLSQAERARATPEAIRESIEYAPVRDEIDKMQEFLKQARFNCPEVNVNALKQGEAPIELQQQQSR